MSRLLSLNLDFVLILQGGLLLLLASVAWELGRRDARPAWFWFGGYALLQALRTGLELAAFEQSAPPFHDFFRQALLAGASLLLVEFARIGYPRGAGRWIFLPLAAGLALSRLIGGETAFAWAAFAVGWMAGLWAAFAFWRGLVTAASGTEARPLRQAGLMIVACQLIGTVPESWLATEPLDLGLALPPLVLRCALYLYLTVAVLRHAIARENNFLSAEHSSSRRYRRTVCCAVVLLVSLAGWIGADLVGRNQDKSMRQQILARTEIAAAAVQAGDVAQLHWDETDLSNPAYLNLKALMTAMRQANADLKFVFLAAVRDEQVYFLVDSESPDSEDYSPPGQLYDEATPEYLAGLAAGRPFVLGPETDRWGTWVFGAAPIIDAHGRTLAYLELDIAAADWDTRIFHARLPLLLITLLIVALLLGAFQSLESLRERSAQIALSEQRNRSLVEGSPDCVQMFDRSGHYLAVNQNGLRALGRTEAEVLGRPFASLWPEETRPRIEEAIRTTLNGQPTSFEADYLTPDGRTVTFRVATNPVFDTKGQVCSFVGICVDLTVRKQAELALLAAKQAAEDATQAKTDFLAVMSHELRTPLAGVIGMLDLLQQSPLEPQPRRYTKFARDSADTLLHLLDDALDSAKMEAGKLALEIIPFGPHEQFESAFESAAMRAAAKGVTFRHEVAPSVPAVLLGDPTRLRQIISNLVNNSIKFTEKGSVTVTLRAEPIGIGSVFLKIAVADTGIGISEEARSRLFTKYAQAESSTTRTYGGTGLGLSIVKSLAELMGGEVGVTSTLGQGSTFTFSAGFRIGTESPRPAPVTTLASVPKVSPAPSVVARPARQLRVLVVDDDVSNRTIAESLVTNLGHRHVAFATNGREAVDRLIAERFDVVLMDNRMPLMDGFTATRLIRDPATGATDPGVYIIALTANAAPEDRARCLAGGMNDFVTKPVRAPAMSAALGRATEHLVTRGKVSPVAPAVSAPAPVAATLPPGLSEAELLAALDADEATNEGSATMPPGMREKITGIFFQETPRRLAAMRSALAVQDSATLGREAHTLKGNARYLDATDLSDLSAHIEKLADRGQLQEIEQLLRDAEQAYATLHERLLPTLPA